jgi:peptidoglycan hydrolase CwlO-like protein
MRRIAGLCLAVLTFGWAVARPVHAADNGTSLQSVQRQLASASQQITRLNQQISDLERSVADTQQRIDQERAEVRLLARVLYAQPDSLLAMLLESSSLSDALIRMADLTSAGDRAAAAKRRLDQDLANLSQQQSELQSELQQQVQLQQKLKSEYGRLVALSQPSLGVSPMMSSVPVPVASSAIQQIILDAFAPLGAAAQQWALRVAKCESGYNPYAVNRATGAAGLFQFLPSTWAATPQHNQSPFDPVANANAAAWLYARDGPGQWQCSAIVG